MLVGEQPGDAEDLSGHPFVGPAGKLLDRCLVEAGIDRAGMGDQRGQAFQVGSARDPASPQQTRLIGDRRMLSRGAKPRSARSAPQIVVSLGATAAQALFGKAFRVSRDRGRPLHTAAGALRARDRASLGAASSHREFRRHENRGMIGDLRKVAMVPTYSRGPPARQATGEPMGSKSTWAAAAAAFAAVIAVAVVVAIFWSAARRLADQPRWLAGDDLRGDRHPGARYRVDGADVHQQPARL